MEYVKINRQNREQVNSFLRKHWFSTDMVIRGKKIDMTQADGILALENDAIVGLLTYTIAQETCEILSLDSLVEGVGLATTLINQLRAIAKEADCKRILVVTTNDNIHAIQFYQKRGFDMARFYHNALDVSRKLKPSIPLLGNFGIPLKHEIEFEWVVPQTPQKTP